MDTLKNTPREGGGTCIWNWSKDCGASNQGDSIRDKISIRGSSKNTKETSFYARVGVDVQVVVVVAKETSFYIVVGDVICCG
jgi:hypothetical protein